MSSDQHKQAPIQGQRVGLRPVEQSDLAVLESWTNDHAIQGSYNMVGLERMNGLASGFQARGLLDDDQATLMIVILDGAIVGSISYHEVRYGPNSGSRAYNIGLRVHKGIPSCTYGRRLKSRLGSCG